MKLSCTDNMVPGKTLTDKARLLKKFGYEGIAVFCSYAEWTEDMFHEISTLEENTGVKPCEFAFTGPIYGHLMDRNKIIQQQAIDMYTESVHVANKIGGITEIEYEYRTQDLCFAT